MTQRNVTISFDERPSMAEVTMGHAHLIALRSTCARQVQVGAVITDFQMTNVYSHGYNGPARGLPNDVCDGKTGACLCVHAEANALIKAPFREFRRDLLMFATLSPCVDCASMILNSAVGCVVYGERYRDDSGIALLTRGRVLCLTIDQFDKGIVKNVGGRLMV